MSIKKIISILITDIAGTVYEGFGFAFICAGVLEILYLGITISLNIKAGVKKNSQNCFNMLKTNSIYRRFFFLSFYIAMVIFRTLINRETWTDPLSDIMGGWKLWTTDMAACGTGYKIEGLENILLLFPFVLLLLWILNEKLKEGRVKLTYIMRKSLGAAFLFSIAIEVIQIVFKRGTFQFADLFYNTLGGGIGGLVYWVGYSRSMKNK